MDGARRSRFMVIGVVAGVAVLAVVFVFIGKEDGSATGPLLVLAGSAAVSALLVLWLRQRPVAPGDDGTYIQTVGIKLAAAEVPALIGFVLAMVTGPGWVAAVGFLVTVALAGWAWPSDSDLERHQLLYLA